MKRITLFAISALILASQYSQAVQCFKENAVKLRAATFAETSHVRSLGESLSGHDSYVYLKDVTDHDSFSEWYVFTNDKAFQKEYAAASEQDITTGFMEQMHPSSPNKFLENYADIGPNQGILDFFESSVAPRLVIIEGDISPPFAYLKRADNPPLILKVPKGSISNNTRNVSSLLAAAPSEFLVIHLLPESSDAVKPWRLDAQKADDFVIVGKRVADDIANYGATISRVKTRQEFTETLKSAHGKHVILIGESPDGGRSVLLPGTDERLSSNDIPNSGSWASIHGLFCDSAHFLSGHSGMSLHGTLYTSQTREILQLVLDKRTVGSTKEYFLLSPIEENWILRTLITLGTLTLGGSTVTLGSSSVADGAASSSAGMPVASIVAEGILTPSGAERSSSRGFAGLYLSGCLGALLRELFRWKRIFSQRRKKAFYRAPYIIISFILILLAGFCGVIFAGDYLGQFQLPVAFVCGAGLEMLVSLSAKLKIWTPTIPQGAQAKQEAPPSMNEFLRF